MILLGSIVDAILAFLGGLIGLIFKRFISEELGDFLIMGQGLVVVLLGVQGMSDTSANLAVVTVCMGIGLLIGYYLDIDAALTKCGDTIERSLNKLMSGKKSPVVAADVPAQASEVAPVAAPGASTSATTPATPAHYSFSTGFIYATIYACTGAMAIIGSMHSGMQGDHAMLFVKGALDMIVCVVLAASMGVGVPFCGVPILIYEGILSLLANVVSPYLSASIVSNIVVTGSLLLLVVGLNLMKLTNIKVANMLPAAFLPVIVLPVYNFICALF